MSIDDRLELLALLGEYRLHIPTHTAHPRISRLCREIVRGIEAERTTRVVATSNARRIAG